MFKSLRESEECSVRRVDIVSIGSSDKMGKRVFRSIQDIKLIKRIM